MASNETLNTEAVSSTGSCIAQPDTSLWPYGDEIVHIDHSFAEAGWLSHETDLLKLGSGLDGEQPMTTDAALDTALGADFEATPDATTREIQEEVNIALDFAALVAQLNHAMRNRDNQSLASLQRLHPRSLSNTINYGIPNPELSSTDVVEEENDEAGVAATNESIDRLANASPRITNMNIDGTSSLTLRGNFRR